MTRFGYFLSCEEYTPDQLIDQARRAEQAGFDALWISDHFHPWTDAQTEETTALTASATAILLGRTTYEMFAPAWSQRTVEDDPGAPFFNDTHKYVVSSSLAEPSWGPASVIQYDAARIAALKDEVDGDVYVSGSATLVKAMLADGLVDSPAPAPPVAPEPRGLDPILADALERLAGRMEALATHLEDARAG